MEAASRSEFEPLTPDPVPSEAPSARPAPRPTSQGAPAGATDALAILQEPATPATTGAPAPMSAPAPMAPPAPMAAPATAPAAGAPVMDRDFIARNQIIERYLSGKLPIKGATEFERFCKDHPELLDEMGLPDRVNAGLRLLEASGKPEPWPEEQPRRLWENPWLPAALGVAALVFLMSTLSLARGRSQEKQTIASLNEQLIEQPLEPAAATRTIRLLPSREGASSAPAVVVGGGQTELVDLLLDLSRSQYREYRVTIDRIDQGRVAIINNLGKDSNGHLRIALNSSALGPGNYQFTIEGLDWRGDPVPDSWVTIGIQH